MLHLSDSICFRSIPHCERLRMFSSTMDVNTGDPVQHSECIPPPCISATYVGQKYKTVKQRFTSVSCRPKFASLPCALAYEVANNEQSRCI